MTINIRHMVYSPTLTHHIVRSITFSFRRCIHFRAGTTMLLIVLCRVAGLERIFIIFNSHCLTQRPIHHLRAALRLTNPRSGVVDDGRPFYSRSLPVILGPATSPLASTSIFCRNLLLVLQPLIKRSIRGIIPRLLELLQRPHGLLAIFAYMNLADFHLHRRFRFFILALLRVVRLVGLDLTLQRPDHLHLPICNSRSRSYRRDGLADSHPWSASQPLSHHRSSGRWHPLRVRIRRCWLLLLVLN